MASRSRTSVLIHMMLDHAEMVPDDHKHLGKNVRVAKVMLFSKPRLFIDIES